MCLITTEVVDLAPKFQIGRYTSSDPQMRKQPRRNMYLSICLNLHERTYPDPL